MGSPRLYLSEIVANISKSMDSSSWTLKKQAGLTLKDVSESVGKDLSEHLDSVLKLLTENLSGRIWKGKESLLIALAAVCNACKDSITSPGPLIGLVAKECKKNDKEYKRQALVSLNGMLKTFSTSDVFEEIKDVIEEIIQEDPEEKGEDDDPKDKPLRLLIR